MLLQKNIVKKYLALLPDEQTQEAWKWVREPSLDPFIGFAFGDKTDLHEDNEGNIHLKCPGNLWNGRSQSKYPSKIDWDDLQ